MRTSVTRIIAGLIFSLLSITGIKAQVASGITFTNVGTNSFTVSWTNGSGVGRICVVRPSANSVALPVDGNAYTYSSSWGSGTNLGSSNYIVYRGTGSSVTVSNLTTYTQYTVTVFEYASGYNYNTIGYPSLSHYTIDTQPTVQASGFNTTNLAPTSATVNWTGGNGGYTLVTLRSGTTNNNIPTDATYYSYSSSYGSGATVGSSPYSYSIYSYLSSTVNVTNLSPSTSYVAAGFDYNGYWSGAQNYMTSGYDTVGFTTLANEPTSTVSYTACTDVWDDAMTISWLNPTSGGGTNRLVLINDNSANDVPIDANLYTANSTYGLGSQIGSSYVVYSGSGNAVRVTGLNMQTSYTIRVFEYNGGAGSFNPSTNYMTYGGYSLCLTNTTQPGSGASNMTFSNINPTSVQVNWTGGTGQAKIVQAKPGRRQTALAFDGVSDHVVVPYNSALQPTAAVTLECWVYKANWATSVATQYIAGNAETGGYCILHSGTYMYTYTYRNGTWGASAIPVNHLSAGWHHFAMSYDGRYHRSYIDGAYYAVNDAGANYPVGYTYANAFIIGADVGTGSTTTGYYLNGMVDEVRVWNTVRYQGQIQSEMNKTLRGNETGLAGYWRLDDGYVTTGTAVNSSLTTANLNGTLTTMTTTAASATTATSGWVNSNSPIDQPVDFSWYSSSATYMNGGAVGTPYYAVMNSTTGNSVTVTGLSPGTYYNFIVTEFDYDTIPYFNYRTQSLLSGEVQTAAGTVPAISNMSPTSGPVGTIVTLTGTGFSTTTTDNIVLFGATKGNVTAATATSLTVLVPYGANHTPVSVSVNGLTGTYTREFIVTSSCTNTINNSSFTASTALTSGLSYETALRDYNNDGKTDIISSVNGVSSFNGLTGLSLNGANPPLFGAYTYSTAQYPYHISVADFDGDKRPDIALTSTGANLLTVHRNTGSTYSSTDRIDIALPYQPSNIKSGDFDGDGRLDLAVAYNSVGTIISVFRNTGSVGNLAFAARQDFAIGTVVPALWVRDLDLDGKADIIFGQQSTAQFGIMRSTSTSGSITFAAAVIVSTTTSAYVNSISCGDFNLDGKPDIVVALSNNTLRYYANNCTVGTISFSYSLFQNTLANSPTSVTCIDLDGDGSPARVEVIVGYGSSNNVSIFEGTGNFGFAARVDIATAGTSSYHVNAGDFNMDGKADIVATPLSSTHNILTNDMDPLAGEPTTPSSALSISAQTQTSLTLNFTAGNGFNRLVVARQGLSVVNTPFDGTGYAANSVFGSGSDVGGNTYVVYNGTGNSVNVTGLLSNTYYYFAVYEYNSNGSACTNNYLLTSATTVTSTLNTPPTLSAIANPSAICQNSGLQTVNFSGVGTGAGNEVQTLSVTASSSNPTLIPNPTVSYISPNATGSLSYTPVAGQYGTSIITVTVNDGGSNNNTTVQTFTVTVTQMPSTSNAGPDQQVCISTATLAATAPTVGIGTWSIIYTSNPSITVANLGNVNVANTILSGLNAGDTVNLAWTITNGGCVASV
ncbi:MAG: cell surface receptor IPT/TIG domain-containing protein, partial [Bacteroidetes bacterium]